MGEVGWPALSKNLPLLFCRGNIPGLRTDALTGHVGHIWPGPGSSNQMAMWCLSVSFSSSKRLQYMFGYAYFYYDTILQLALTFHEVS